MPGGNTGGAPGGKAGMSGTSGKGMDAEASKGTRLKDGADHRAVGPSPLRDDWSSRETSPHRSPSNQHSRECYTLLFGVESLTPHEQGPGSYMLPAYAWTKRIIWDTLPLLKKFHR